MTIARAGSILCLFVVAAAVATVAVARPGLAAEKDAGGLRCLSRAEQRARTASHAVVPLSRAMSAAKAKHSEVVRASLCEHEGRLVYRLTVLHGGSVATTLVDAGNGAVITGR